jgi:hypothetical protein
MTSPWVVAEPLPDEAYVIMRRRAIFDCCKWDPQVEDVASVGRTPLILTQDAWDELARLAALLAAETLDAEAELRERPELHSRLGLARGARSALGRAARDPAAGVARLIRFDFHPTTEGWRISEANTDVPGGLNEASGFPMLVAPHYPHALSAGDPAGAYVAALLADAPPGARVALAHATAFSDDRQMMVYLARRLEAAGARPVLCSPANLRWREGRASLAGEPLDRVVRFFPADWLTELPGSSGWSHLYAGGLTPVSNPATALLTQSKRWPLTWDALRTPLPEWRRLLPDTRDPRDVPSDDADGWVLKPALGRVGEDVALPGHVAAKDWQRIRRAAARHPERWVAQRRFDATTVAGRSAYPCVGVYTVDRTVVGAYGRVAARPLIDSRAEDAAVLVSAGVPVGAC